MRSLSTQRRKDLALLLVFVLGFIMVVFIGIHLRHGNEELGRLAQQSVWSVTLPAAKETEGATHVELPVLQETKH